MHIQDLDKTDRAILMALQEDGRMTNAELAERVHLSPSACLRRTRVLEESGLIDGYVMLLNHDACGKSGTAFVMITLIEQGRETLNKFEKAVSDIPEILSCYLLAGTADYLLHIVHRDATDLERIHTEILTALPGVSRVQTTVTLRTVKNTTKIDISR